MPPRPAAVPLPLLIAVDKGAHRRRAFAVACRVALPLHLAAVTLWGSPIIAGELATTGDTHSRAPVLLHLRPPRVSTQIRDHRGWTL
jgi:hypothetical protein